MLPGKLSGIDLNLMDVLKHPDRPAGGEEEVHAVFEVQAAGVISAMCRGAQLTGVDMLFCGLDSLLCVGTLVQSGSHRPDGARHAHAGR